MLVEGGVISAMCLPLKKYAGFPLTRGIKTGYNDAFIVNNATRDTLVARDPKSAEILKPILRGRDIKRYRANWAGMWLIATLPALRLDIDRYPVIKEYLESFGKHRLEQSGAPGSRKRTGGEWFEMQDNIAYHREFLRDKIVYPAIMREAKSMRDESFLGFSWIVATSM